MNRIPTWGKIAGGCGILFVVFLLVAGCAGIVAVLSHDPEPTSQPTVQVTPEPEPETTEPEPVPEPETTEPTPAPTEPAPQASDTQVNTCVPDVDQLMAETVASVTYEEVTIFTDQVYVVPVDVDASELYVVAGSDQGTIIFYVTSNVNGDSMAYAANQAAYDLTLLDYPENLGAPEIDKDSEAYKVAEGCVS